ncbi:unnamed protein product, partial [marine sediment metagenome]
MGLKDTLKKLVTSHAKEISEPLKILDRMKQQAEAAKKAGETVRSE